MSPGPISFSSLLTGLDPSSCKAHFATPNPEGDHPIVALRDDPDGAWIGWNRWRPDRDVFKRDFIVSFAQMPRDPKQWLFGGVFRVTARRPEPHAFSYDVERRDDLPLSAFERRLQVHFAGLKRTTRLNLEGVLEAMTVTTVLPEVYAGLEFPGLDRVDLTLGDLATIHEQQRADWRYALETVKGVYVIRDHPSGGLYVGSASGETGIWSRWGDYAGSVHGHNKALRELVGRATPEHARTKMSIALLESFTPRTDDAVVLDRERYWKAILGSREGPGLNRN